MNMDEINKQIEAARKIMQPWPEWKKRVLVQSAKSTVSAPRTPVNNSDQNIEAKKIG